VILKTHTLLFQSSKNKNKNKTAKQTLPLFLTPPAMWRSKEEIYANKSTHYFIPNLPSSPVSQMQPHPDLSQAASLSYITNICERSWVSEAPKCRSKRTPCECKIPSVYVNQITNEN
jgi:hypothetical protein